MSMSGSAGRLATVFGGTGFVGEQIVRAMARGGYRIRAAVRRPARGYRLPMLGDVGQIQVVRADIADPQSVRRAMAGAQVCVNAAGILYPSGRQTFAAVHVEGARAVADEARAAGVGRLIHISALGADSASASLYARTKSAGEEAVRAAFVGAVVVRPSIVFGPRDAFFNRFASMALRSFALPLIGGGHTRFQPVFVGDVARAVTAALCASTGATLELGGPAVLSFRALMELMLVQIERKRLLIPVPFGAAAVLAVAGDAMAACRLTPPITSDQLRLLHRDNVVSNGAPGLASLGIEPTSLEAVLPGYLWRYRPGGQFAATPVGDGPGASQSSGAIPT